MGLASGHNMAPQEFQPLNPVCDHASLDWLQSLLKERKN